MSAAPGAEGGAPAPMFLRGLWYFAALSGRVRAGRLRRQMLLGEPVLIGRMRDGTPFALRDICPHRGVPLSAGRVTPENSIECSYHGWRFRADGVCSLIPSLVEGQDIDPAKIRVRSYPVREQDGLLWVYFAPDERQAAAPANEPPRVQVPGAKPRWVESQTFHCNLDEAVIGLMDPAHAPYVHGRWWWKKTPRVKEKAYAPLPTGFVMLRHPPSKTAYKLLGGDVTTEITFELPGIRFENISGTVLGRRIDVVGFTACAPMGAGATQVTQVFYWPAWLSVLKPLFAIFGPIFLSDDRKMAELQQEGLKFNPSLMLIQDSDAPAIWYRRMKKAWAASIETGAPFVNPVQPRILRWRS